jgi:hypothetical protein
VVAVVRGKLDLLSGGYIHRLLDGHYETYSVEQTVYSLRRSPKSSLRLNEGWLEMVKRFSYTLKAIDTGIAMALTQGQLFQMPGSCWCVKTALS